MSSWRSARTLNLGAGGMRFRGEDSLESGTMLEVRLTLPAADEPLIVCGSVIWSDMKAAGVSEHGIEFVDLTPEQAAQIDHVVQFMKRATD